MRLLRFLITNSLPISNPFQLRSVRAFHEAWVWRDVYIEFEANLFHQLFRLFIDQAVQVKAEALSVDDLIFLLNSSAECEGKREGRQNLDEEVVGSARDCLTVPRLDPLQQFSQPGSIAQSFARLQQAILSKVDGNLHAAFPAAFLDIEHTSHVMRRIVGDFRPKKKGDAVLGCIRCRWNSHDKLVAIVPLRE